MPRGYLASQWLRWGLLPGHRTGAPSPVTPQSPRPEPPQAWDGGPYKPYQARCSYHHGARVRTCVSTRTVRVPLCPHWGLWAALGVSFPRATSTCPAAQTPAGLPSPRTATRRGGSPRPSRPRVRSPRRRARGLGPGRRVGIGACERPEGRGRARDLGSGPAPPPAPGAKARGPRPPLRPGRAKAVLPPLPRPSSLPPAAPLTWL